MLASTCSAVFKVVSEDIGDGERWTLPVSKLQSCGLMNEAMIEKDECTPRKGELPPRDEWQVAERGTLATMWLLVVVIWRHGVA